MTPSAVGVSPAWLDQREPADAAARDVKFVDELRRRLPDSGLIVHDLGSGTGSLTRWLAPRLPGPQHWVLHDQDPRLLEVAAERAAGIRAADGSVVTLETRHDDVTRLRSDDLADATLVTCSALLDVLTDEELLRVVRLCTAARCPAWFTLTVVGRVELTPRDPVDAALSTAFNEHQRRPARGGWLLGPDAVAAATRLFRDAAADVLIRPSPWRLGGGQAQLTTAWFDGWAAAACELQPELGPAIESYVRRRLHRARAGTLRVTVHHDDLLAVPRAELTRQ